MIDSPTILLVEDDPAVALGAAQALMLADIAVETFPSVEAVRPRLLPGFAGAIVTDVRLPGASGLDLLAEMQRIDPGVPVILVTGHGEISMAVRAMQGGAYDFIEKPFASGRLVDAVRRALEKRGLALEVATLRRRLDEQRGIESVLLGRSAAIERVRKVVLDLAGTSADVLVYGETGTGKDLVARCLHDHGRRRKGRYVALNCGAIPEAIFESEVFGHEAGAFTGAGKRRIGRIEHANGGTVFLDEVESMPLVLQVKLLRVLQERAVERLGANDPVPVDVRIVAAAKVDLKALSDAGRFRADLYYRLGVAVVELPPLRERRDDIPLLFGHFVALAADRYERPVPDVPAAYVQSLMRRDWPGNVRELRNAADRLVLGLEEGGSLDGPREAANAGSLTSQVDRFERMVLEDALRRAGGQVAQVSESLGIPRKTLYDKLKKHGIVAERFRK